MKQFFTIFLSTLASLILIFFLGIVLIGSAIDATEDSDSDKSSSPSREVSELAVQQQNAQKAKQQSSGTSKKASGQSSSSEKSAAANGQDTASDATVITDEAATAQSAQAEASYLTVGSTFSSDGIDTALASVTTSYGNGWSEPEPGYVYLVLNWAVANNSQEDFSTFNISFNAYVDGTATDLALTTLPGGFDSLQTLPPGTNEVGNIVYEVPENWQECQVRVQNGMLFGETVTFRFTPEQVSQA